MHCHQKMLRWSTSAVLFFLFCKRKKTHTSERGVGCGIVDSVTLPAL